MQYVILYNNNQLGLFHDDLSVVKNVVDSGNYSDYFYPVAILKVKGK